MTTYFRLENVSSDHWQAHARQWSLIASPLRPHLDDIEIMRNFLCEHFRDGHRGCGLLLGVTPELAELSDNIVALDRERAMIDMLRAFTQNKNSAVQGNWLDLPFASQTFDFALGDGSFNLLRYPLQYHALFEQLRTVLRSNAQLLLRIFTAPMRQESLATVVDAAHAKKIESFHAFKWRFAMALVARNRDPNIGVADIHREFEQWIPDRVALSTYANWPLETINTIDIYRNSSAVYSFPTVEEWSRIAAQHSVEVERACGHYELAERCPIVSLRVNT